MSKSVLNGFTKLNDITTIYRPKENDKKTQSSDPCLIVYCAWMGAATKHIDKYVAGYKQLFPSSSILVIESTLPNMFMGSDLTAAVEVIESFSQDREGQQQQMILHACSNGGGANSSWLAERLLKNSPKLPFDRFILDCCPGKPEVKTATEAVSISLPKQALIRFVGSWLIWTFFISMKLVNTTFGIEDGVTLLRRTFNDANVFSIDMPRMYLYSDCDVLVKSLHVHEHAEDARLKGYAVREERFSKASHVALLQEDSERYWNAVKELVDDGKQMQEIDM